VCHSCNSLACHRHGLYILTIEANEMHYFINLFW